jgi:exopolyphosphatase/guanosine-5'-triphosphate,3'-diphosphate pyrophosphatase
MRAAVVDVGSNSIKLLVADGLPAGGITEVLSKTLEARIGTGIGSAEPSLSEQGMERGIAAIGELVGDARRLGAEKYDAVATSAVRDAANGAAFRDRVLGETGLSLRILSGTEEADGIGRGLMTDPALAGLRDFHVYDLGGGSLECLSFRNRTLGSAVSLQLGCVRMTEMFVALAEGPVAPSELAAIASHVTAILTRSGFALPVAPGTAVVGTGGTLTTVRAILAAREGIPFKASDTTVRVASLRELLSLLAPLDIKARRAVPGLPAARADVFPAALATLVALANLGTITAFRHSLRNLRWGLAAALLD